MGKWEKSVITEMGYALLTKLHTGTTLTLTRAVAGAESVPTTELKTLESVPDERQELSFSTTSYPEEHQCSVLVKLYNKGLTQGYTAQLIGIYADDPDEGEILYMVTRAAGGTYIPAESELPYSASWVFHVKYGEADGVTITADPAASVSIEEAAAMIAAHDGNESAHPFIREMLLQVINQVGTLTPGKIGAAPAYSYGTEDLVAGETNLETGKLHFVYE